eukprot:19356-Amphidinium_carterae.1
MELYWNLEFGTFPDARKCTSERAPALDPVQAYSAEVKYNATHPHPEVSLLEIGSQAMVQDQEAFTMQYFHLLTPLMASLSL